MTRDGRPKSTTAKALAAILAAPGSTFPELYNVIGGSRNALGTLLCKHNKLCTLFAVGSRSHMRYFPTAELAAAWCATENATKAEQAATTAKLPPKPRKGAWTPEQIALLREHYPSKGGAYTSLLVGHGLDATVQQAYALKIARLYSIKGRALAPRKASIPRDPDVTIAAVAHRRGPAYLDGPLVFTDRTIRTVYAPPPRALRTNTHFQF